MPQLKPDEVGDSQVIQSDNTPFRERLFERFSAYDFVRVKNIDDERFDWQWMPIQAEETFSDGDSRIVLGRRSYSADYSLINPGNEQYWAMEPGVEEVLLGENALIFIEGLYKRVVAKRMIKKTPKTDRTRNFNWGNGNMQEQIIDEIFLGVETPQFGGKQSAPAGPPAN